jgi:RHS repeat-associated protein
MGYDRVGRLTSVGVTDTVTNAAIQNYSYTYDANGNRTNAQVGSALYPAQSNVLNQYVAVTSPTSEAFAGSLSEPGTVTVAGASATMDGSYTNFMASVAIPSGGATNNVPVVATSANGYATTNTYQVVVPPSSASPAYDANGNLTSDSTRAYYWNARGELVKITYADTSYSTFAYNGAGQRVEMQEYDSTPSHNLTSTKQFVGGSMLTEERDASNIVTKRLFAQGEQQISGSTPTSFYYTRDHLGSIRELTDTTGAVQARYAYDPYGQRTKLSGSADTEMGFTGHYYHSASGLYLSPTRAYDAKIGRWISRDTSGEEAGLNLYAYCNDDPIDFTDSSGMCLDDPGSWWGDLLGGDLPKQELDNSCVAASVREAIEEMESQNLPETQIRLELAAQNALTNNNIKFNPDLFIKVGIDPAYAIPVLNENGLMAAQTPISQIPDILAVGGKVIVTIQVGLSNGTILTHELLVESQSSPGVYNAYDPGSGSIRQIQASQIISKYLPVGILNPK